MRRRDVPVWKRDSSRSMTPTYRDNEPYLSYRSSSTEGIYEVECWPTAFKTKIDFHLYHQGKFKDHILTKEQTFSSEQETLDWYRRYSNTYTLKSLLDVRNKFNTPVLLRDEAISKLRHDSAKCVKRTRNRRAYFIYFDYITQACDNWAETHVHNSRVYVLNTQKRVVAEEIFDCDNVWKGYERYQFILENFDMAMMEWQL